LPNGRRLRSISTEAAIRAFARYGYVARRSKGSHIRLVKQGAVGLTLPQRRELGVGLLSDVIRKAGLTVEEFLELLGE